MFYLSLVFLGYLIWMLAPHFSDIRDRVIAFISQKKSVHSEILVTRLNNVLTQPPPNDLMCKGEDHFFPIHQDGILCRCHSMVLKREPDGLYCRYASGYNQLQQGFKNYTRG